MTTTPLEELNPLVEGLPLRRRPEPCVIVIFGASGDLAHKKLMPALYALAVRRLLPPRFAIVGVARTGKACVRLIVSRGASALSPSEVRARACCDVSRNS